GKATKGSCFQSDPKKIPRRRRVWDTPPPGCMTLCGHSTRYGSRPKPANASIQKTRPTGVVLVGLSAEHTVHSHYLLLPGRILLGDSRGSAPAAFAGLHVRLLGAPPHNHQGQDAAADQPPAPTHIPLLVQ